MRKEPEVAVKNSKSHGVIFSEETGEVSVRTQLFSFGDDDELEPEIVIYCLEDRQLAMIRVVTPDGDTHRFE